MFYKTGPYNQSGEWKGVMGDVVSGKHSVSLSAWSWFIERDSFLDFVPVVKGTTPILRQQRDWVGGVIRMVFFADVQCYLC